MLSGDDARVFGCLWCCRERERGGERGGEGGGKGAQKETRKREMPNHSMRKAGKGEKSDARRLARQKSEPFDALASKSPPTSLVSEALGGSRALSPPGHDTTASCSSTRMSKKGQQRREYRWAEKAGLEAHFKGTCRHRRQRRQRKKNSTSLSLTSLAKSRPPDSKHRFLTAATWKRTSRAGLSPQANMRSWRLSERARPQRYESSLSRVISPVEIETTQRSRWRFRSN